MSYAVLHMKKIKGNGVTGMQIHNQREKESDTNKDIKKDQMHLNYDLENENPIDYHEKIKEMIDERVDQSKRKVRKDAVKVASFMITSDKAFFDRIGEKEEKRFFETARDFIGQKYGKEKIAYAMVHKDEKTPHMHLGLVPITEDNRLSAKDFFGKKQQLHKLQDDFHAHMQEHGFDLERGLSSDSKHLEPAQYKLKTTQDKIKALEESLEKIEEIDQIDEKVKEGRFTNKVTMNREDFEAFKGVAKAGIVTLEENKLLEGKLDDLRASNTYEVQTLQRQLKQAENERNEFMDRNMQLLKENKQLKKQKEDLIAEKLLLKGTIDVIKNFCKDRIKDFDKFVGIWKADILDQLEKKTGKDLSHIKKYLDADEEKGFQTYLKQEQKEKQKQKDDFELE
ncbi:MobV family relaxase [Paraliobacillus sp. JSM ZJ581]|uniref:MobV family relaxase n=1 Tax=Paraliobacillus sp. JSM ZJ581 TaxID=3342118 RepID=UPI0035A8B477